MVRHYTFDPDGTNDGLFHLDGPESAGIEVIWFGAGDPISATVGAYAIFDEPWPEFVGFAPAADIWGGPDASELEVKRFGRG